MSTLSLSDTNDDKEQRNWPNFYNIHMYRAQCVSIMKKTYHVALKRSVTAVDSQLPMKRVYWTRVEITWPFLLRCTSSDLFRIVSTWNSFSHLVGYPSFRRASPRIFSYHYASSMKHSANELLYMVFIAATCVSEATQWNRSVKSQPQVREWVSNATRIIICHGIVAMSTVSLKFLNRMCKSFPSFI